MPGGYPSKGNLPNFFLEFLEHFPSFPLRFQGDGDGLPVYPGHFPGVRRRSSACVDVYLVNNKVREAVNEARLNCVEDMCPAVAVRSNREYPASGIPQSEECIIPECVRHCSRQAVLRNNRFGGTLDHEGKMSATYTRESADFFT